MAKNTPTAPTMQAERTPLLSYCSFSIGLRYLLRKKLSYLAVIGVALSVATLIVVMSVFTGFHIQLTAAIRGYLSDLTIRPVTGRLHGVNDWQSWREQIKGVEHVEGAAPFVEGFALLRLPGTDHMGHVFFRGIHPQFESEVSELPRYMKVGNLEDLSRTYPDPDNPAGKPLRACFVGKEFAGFSPPLQLSDPDRLDVDPGHLILITVTSDLERRFAVYAVNGMFETAQYDYDSKFVIIGLDTAMDLVRSHGSVSGMSVRLDDYDNAEKVRAELRQRLSAGATLQTLGDSSVRAERVELSRDGSRLAALTDAGEAIVWVADSGQQLQRVAAQSRKPTALALDPDGTLLVLGYEDGAVVVHEVDTGEEAFSIPANGDAVTAACFSPVGWFLAVGYSSGAAGIWDADTGEKLAALEGHDGPVNVAVFDSESERLLTAGADGTARLWTADEKGKHLLALSSPFGGSVTAAAFSGDGATVLTGDAEGRVAMWDAESARQTASWLAHDGAVHAVGFGWRPDVVMSAGADGTLLWLVRAGRGLTTLPPYLTIGTENAPLKDTVLREDGMRSLSIGQDGLLRLRYCGPGFSIMTWEEQQKTFLEAVAMERFLQALIISLILVVAEFFIFAIVTTMVNERRRDVGILKAIGFTQGQICLVFLMIGLAIGVVGGLLGVGMGILFTDNINVIREVLRDTIHFDPFPPTVYYFTEIPTHIGILTPVLSAAGAIVCSLLFSIFPALRAARMDPVETLRYE